LHVRRHSVHVTRDGLNYLTLEISGVRVHAVDTGLVVPPVESKCGDLITQTALVASLILPYHRNHHDNEFMPQLTPRFESCSSNGDWSSRLTKHVSESKLLIIYIAVLVDHQ